MVLDTFEAGGAPARRHHRVAVCARLPEAHAAARRLVPQVVVIASLSTAALDACRHHIAETLAS